MRKAFILAAVAAIGILAVSCSKEESKEVQTFKASAEQTSETSKISLSGLSLRWSADDTLSIYDNASSHGLYVLAGSPGSSRCDYEYYMRSHPS